MAYDWHSAVAPPAGTVNPRLGVRFDRTGRFLPEAGNTVVAQVIPASPTEQALVWLRDELMALPYAHHFTFTDVASYHMTVFEGVIETRRASGHWPATLPLDVSIDSATEAMTVMLRNLPTLPGFKIRPVEVTPFGLVLAGATQHDVAAANQWRDRLSDALGYRTPDYESYMLHTTLAYAHIWLPVAALPVYASAMARLTKGFLARVPAMHLARPAFCRFQDMNAFPPVLAL